MERATFDGAASTSMQWYPRSNASPLEVELRDVDIRSPVLLSLESTSNLDALFVNVSITDVDDFRTARSSTGTSRRTTPPSSTPRTCSPG